MNRTCSCGRHPASGVCKLAMRSAAASGQLISLLAATTTCSWLAAGTAGAAAAAAGTAEGPTAGPAIRGPCAGAGVLATAAAAVGTGARVPTAAAAGALAAARAVAAAAAAGFLPSFRRNNLSLAAARFLAMRSFMAGSVTVAATGAATGAAAAAAAAGGRYVADAPCIEDCTRPWPSPTADAPPAERAVVAGASG